MAVITADQIVHTDKVHTITDATPKKTHVLISTPCYGGLINVGYFQATLKLQMYLQQTRTDIDVSWHTVAGESLITRARNDAVKMFIENDAYTHLLFIDADIEFEPIHFERLIDSGHPLCAQIYPLKTVDWQQMLDASPKDKLAAIAASLHIVVNKIDSSSEAKEGFTACQDAGTGFMMIERSVITKMMAEYPELEYTRDEIGSDGNDKSWAFFDTMIDNGRYLSEDYTFCRRWQNMGGEVMVDLTTPILIHTGVYQYGKV